MKNIPSKAMNIKNRAEHFEKSGEVFKKGAHNVHYGARDLAKNTIKAAGAATGVLTLNPVKATKAAYKAGKHVGNASMSAAKAVKGAAQMVYGGAEALKSLNHPEWYTRGTSGIPVQANFATRMGTDSSVAAFGNQVVGMLLRADQFPAMTDGQFIAYNDAMRKIYAQIRAKNSGYANYTVNAVTAYIESVRGIMSLLAHANKQLSIPNALDNFIANSPKQLVRIYTDTDVAMESEFEDVTANAANYVNQLAYIRDLIVETIPIVPGLSVIQRDKFLFSTIFKDYAGTKPTYTMYIPNPFMIEYHGDEGIIGVTTSLKTLKNTIADLRTFITKFTADQTYQIIAGDIIKAYGMNKDLHIEISQFTAPNIIVDQYHRDQLKNTIVAEKSSGSLTFDNTNGFEQNIVISSAYVLDTANNNTSRRQKLRPFGRVKVLASQNANPSEGELLSVTRNMIHAEPLTTGTATGALKTVSSVLIGAMTLVYRTSVSNSYISAPLSSDTNNLALMTALTQMESAPIIMTASAATTGVIGLSGDVDDYALITDIDLGVYNDVATLSMYHVPSSERVKLVI